MLAQDQRAEAGSGRTASGSGRDGTRARLPTGTSCGRPERRSSSTTSCDDTMVTSSPCARFTSRSRRWPIIKTLEVLRLDGPSYRLVGTWHDDAAVRAEPFDALALDLAALWAR
jgi:hypothetical protein